MGGGGVKESVGMAVKNIMKYTVWCMVMLPCVSCMMYCGNRIVFSTANMFHCMHLLRDLAVCLPITFNHH